MKRRSTRATRGPRPAAPASPAAFAATNAAGVRAALVLLLLAIVLAVGVRLRLADVPLERDEGEYAYAGQLILEGVAPYDQVYNMKFPGVYYAYAAVMAVFGQTAWGIRVGLLCVHLATAGFVFLLGRRLAGPLAAALGTAAFLVLGLDRWSMGVFGHATHFVSLAAAAGLFVLHRAVSGGRAGSFVAAGALMGMALLMKQHAFPFVALAVGLAGLSHWRRAALVLAGVAVTLAGLVALLAAEGVLARFWFWTFQYAAAYVSQTPITAAIAGLQFSLRYITQATAVLWWAAAAGLAFIFAARWSPGARGWIMAWALAAAISIVPGFYFRPHYFLVLLPVLGLLIGIGASSLGRGIGRLFGPTWAGLAAVAVAAVVLGSYVRAESRYLFSMPPPELVRALYDTNPFLESPEIARYLAEHTTPDERIAVLGSEPQIYFLARRRSATGYIYTYPLMEEQPYAARMQDEMRREIEAGRPAYLVFVASPLSWGGRPGSNMGLLTWASEYAQRCYDRVGVIDIPRRGPAIVRWDEASRGYEAREASQVWVLRRRAGVGCG